MSTPTALMPFPRQQFFTANGQVLAGGFLYTYAAGTSTPLAAYTDSTGNTPLSNPIVLDAGGMASIWLSSANYKIVAQDANGVQQWSVDNVSAVSQAELQGTNSFSSLSVSGNLTVGGNIVVSGAITAASESITGALSVGGTATLQTANVTGNESVGGTLGVTGAATFSGGETITGGLTVDSITVGGQSLTAFVNALIPHLERLERHTGDFGRRDEWQLGHFHLRHDQRHARADRLRRRHARERLVDHLAERVFAGELDVSGVDQQRQQYFWEQPGRPHRELERAHHRRSG